MNNLQVDRLQTSEYIAIEHYSDTLIMFYEFHKSDSLPSWQCFSTVYDIVVARHKWERWTAQGWERVVDPYPNIRVGNSAIEENNIVTIQKPTLQNKMKKANALIAKAHAVTKRKN